MSTIETKMQFRGLEFDPGAIDEKARTVKVRFSSEYPVQRDYFDGANFVKGDEILDHDPKSVRLGRLNDGAPVILDHDHKKVVGVVENATIDADRVGRAVLRFGKSKQASEVFDDVKDGIRRGISVGYRVHKIVKKTVNKVRQFVVTDWEPYEITFTGVQADPTAQVGRSEKQSFKTEVIEIMETKNVEVVDAEKTIESVQKRELERIDTLMAMGDQYECADLAREYITAKKTVAEMTEAVLDVVAKRAAESKPVTQIGLTKQETQQYSLIRAIRAAHDNDWSKAPFEREVNIALTDEVGRDPEGFYVPFEVQERNFNQDQQRVMVTSSGAAGGFLKGTDHLAGSFIDQLRAQALLGRLNARFLPGLVGDVDIPRLDTGATFGWVTEDADGTPADAVLGQLLLSPKTVTAHVPISRRLLKQSAPSVEQMLLDDMAKGAALAIDLAGFEGSGAAGQPTGIVNTTGVGVSAVADITNGIPTHAELVEFETDVAEANGLVGTLGYVTTAGVRGGMKTTALDAGSGVFMYQNGQANGYPVDISTQLTAQRIVFGNYEDVIIGMWGVLDVYPDKAAKAAAGGLVLRVFQDVDIGVRHAGSFSIDG